MFLWQFFLKMVSPPCWANGLCWTFSFLFTDSITLCYLLFFLLLLLLPASCPYNSPTLPAFWLSDSPVSSSPVSSSLAPTPWSSSPIYHSFPILLFLSYHHSFPISQQEQINESSSDHPERAHCSIRNWESGCYVESSKAIKQTINWCCAFFVMIYIYYLKR